MSHFDQLKSHTRRDFLKTVVAVTGAMVAGASLKRVAFGWPPALSLRVGVLLPPVEAVRASFLAGMGLYLSAANFTIDLVPVDIGYGANAVLRNWQKLIDEAHVQLTVGYFNPGLIPILTGAKERPESPLLISHTGANMLRQGESAPHIFQNSLGHWQASYALGRWAAQHLGRTAFVAASFYDSGYDAPYAFRAGFERAGGEVVQSYKTHLPTGEDDLAGAIKAIQAQQPDIVYAAFSGQSAVEFLEAFGAANLAKQTRLLGSGFMPAALATQRRLAMTTAAGWTSTLVTPENQTFMADYEAYTGQPANAIAALGYDTAQLIEQAVQVGGFDPDLLQAALPRVSVSGPRGLVSLISENGYQSGCPPLYLQLPDGAALELESGFPVDSKLEALYAGQRTGWLNPYLCA